MEVEKLAIFAGFGFALAVGAFVLWGPSPKPRRRGTANLVNSSSFYSLCTLKLRYISQDKMIVIMQMSVCLLQNCNAKI